MLSCMYSIPEFDNVFFVIFNFLIVSTCLLSVHDHQVILEKIEARENLNNDEYVEEGDY